MTITEALTLAQTHHQVGRLGDAEAVYRQILSFDPNHADAMHLLGVLAHQLGREPQALELINRSIVLRKDRAAYYTNQGVVLNALGRFQEAEAALRHGLKLRPDMPDALANLSEVLRKQKKLPQAVAAARESLGLDPHRADAANNLGNALLDQGKRDEAIAAFRHAVAIRPDYAEGYCSLGSALAEKGDLTAAAEALREALVRRENFPQAWDLLGGALQRMGKLPEAEKMYARAVELQPGFEAAWNHLAKVLGDQAKWPPCIDAYRRAIALNPANTDALNNMGIALALSNRLAEAIEAYKQAIALQPDLPNAHTNLGNAYQEDGQLDLALQCANRALEIKPDYPFAHSNKIFLLHFHPDYDAAAIGREAARWNQIHALPLRKSARRHDNDPSPERRLRVGFVSPYFCSQSESFFVVPLLRAHDRAQVEVFGYSSVPAPDDVTKITRGHCDVWREAGAWDDARLARQIREDRIDILVDPVMHMGGSRLLAFARKPAPVQVSWLAYPGTTGLTAIDYRLTDPWLDPPGTFDEFYSETSIRLPDSWCCFDPLFEVPSRGPHDSGPIHFGSLNNPCKLNPGTIRLWSQILAAVENSRLLIQSPTPGFTQRTTAAFADCGIAAGRLEFLPRVSRVEYLRFYGRIDIALDPQPYNGITTTCDALWMNVPVVTQIGSRAAGRAGLSILSNVGLNELVADTESDFIKITASLAHDLPRLREYHATLRDRFLKSPICDAARFARNVEAAYRQVWRKWCEVKD